MAAYQMWIRLSDEARELERPRGGFRMAQPGKSTEDGLASEMAALLESLGVPHGGPSIHYTAADAT
jgi:hypothetical protein